MVSMRCNFEKGTYIHSDNFAAISGDLGEFVPSRAARVIVHCNLHLVRLDSFDVDIVSSRDLEHSAVLDMVFPEGLQEIPRV